MSSFLTVNKRYTYATSAKCRYHVALTVINKNLKTLTFRNNMIPLNKNYEIHKFFLKKRVILYLFTNFKKNSWCKR